MGRQIEYSSLVSIDEERGARFKLLAEMREPFQSVTAEEIEREVTGAIAEVRREKRLLAGGQLQHLGTEEYRGERVE